MTFPYPGDDPSTLVDVMSDISSARVRSKNLPAS